MGKILSIATAALKDGQLADINHQCFPRVDYIELQKRIHADTMDYSTYDHAPLGKHLRRLEVQLRSDIYLASIGWMKSRTYPTVFAWSERAGIPFAAYQRFLPSRNRFVTMFQCWSSRQEAVITRLGLFSVMDDIVVHCDSMHKNLVRLGAPAEKVHTIHYSIDQRYFTPDTSVQTAANQIMSVGERRSRNYPALFKAVDGLPVSLAVPAFGHWYAREKNRAVQAPIPANVSLVKHMSQFELKGLYARSAFVVLPVHDLIFSAGATATLEAGSMGKAVIAFRSQGIQDYIVDGETGILVEPGNVSALREAIEYLLANPQEARRMGENARQRVIERFNLERYVNRIAALLSGRQGSLA